MKAYSDKEQGKDSSSEQVMTEETTKLPYESPEVTLMGRVEQLTAIFGQGSPDLLGGHSLL